MICCELYRKQACPTLTILYPGTRWNTAMTSRIMIKMTGFSVKTKNRGPSERLTMEREHGGSSDQSSEKGVTL